MAYRLSRLTPMTYSLQMEPRQRRRLPCAAGLLAFALGAACANAHATTYSLPGALTSSPFNCTQTSATSYICADSLTLPQNTQLNLQSDITLEITGSLSTAQNFTTVNNGHGMTLIVRGALSMAQNVDVQMDIAVNGAMTADGNARIAGNITVGDQYTPADLKIGQNSTVTGNVTSTRDIVFEQNVTLNGSAEAIRDVTFDSSPKINGNVTAGNNAQFGQNAEIKGTITATGDMEFRQNPKITGDVNSGKSINFAQNTHVTGNIKAGNNLDFDQNTVITGNVTATNQLTGKKNSTTVTGNCSAKTIIDMSCHTTGTPPAAGNLHHIRLTHSGSGVTCAPSPVTVTACSGADSNGACTPYTSGVSGTVDGSGAAGSASFSIAPGSSSTTVSISDTTAQTVTLSTTALSVSAANATTCWNSASSSASCSHTYATAGFRFDVEDHVANTPQKVKIWAVRSAADQTNVCAPAFTSTTNVNLTCAYVNPGTGSKVITFNGQPQPVCNSAGEGVALQFDSNGLAEPILMYPDAGSMSLTIGYPPFGMSSSDGFVTAPARFVFGFVQATAQAGVALAGKTVNGETTPTNLTAVTAGGLPTPNFGRESPASAVTISFSKCLPVGGSAGVSSGTVGTFSNGVARPIDMKWSEAGWAYLTAALTSGHYLNSGLNVSGTSGSGGVCNAPDGTGAIRFTPAYFTTALSPAQVYSYSGQPLSTVRVTPYNGDNAVTTNYTGDIATDVMLKPMYKPASAVIDVPAARGALTPNKANADAFTAGTPPTPVGADVTPAYTFAAPSGALGAAHGPLQLIVRAENNDASSAGHAEATTQIRFGRLRVTNAYGRANGALSIPLQAQYWTGLSWIINSDDNTTLLPDAAVALTASSASGVSARGEDVRPDGSRATQIRAGKATLSLLKANAVPGYIDLAFNLGGTGADASCLANHPATTGAAVPWLRSLNGCANDYGRDPSARATFGIFKPESKATIHVRERFD